MACTENRGAHELQRHYYHKRLGDRKRAGLSQEQVAEKIGTNFQKNTMRIITLSLLALLVSGNSHGQNQQPYPSLEEIISMEAIVAQGDWKTIYALVNKTLIKLPGEPWPEPAKQLLLKIARWDMARVDSLRKGLQTGQIPEGFDHDVREAFGGNLELLISSQEDIRFLSFLKDRLGGSLLAAKGLASLGEPAFNIFLKELNREGEWTSQPDAVWGLTLMLQKERGFLHTNQQKRQILRSVLMQSVQTKGISTRLRAIDALSHFRDEEVKTLLDFLSKHDTLLINGKYPIRDRAKSVLRDQVEEINKHDY